MTSRSRSDVYEVSCEVEPNGAPGFPSDCAGAFVRCYLPATSIEESIRGARGHLEADGYRVLDVDWSIRIDPEEWEQPEPDGYPSSSELAELRGSEEYLYSVFLSYVGEA